MKKAFILILAFVFSFSSVFAQNVDSKNELNDLKRDVDSLKNELEILKLKKDMEKLQGELSGLKTATSNTATPLPSANSIVVKDDSYPFKKNMFSVNFAGYFYASGAKALANNYYHIRNKHQEDGKSFPYIIPGTVTLKYYGINLISERMISSNVSFAFEYGYNWGKVYFADNTTSELKVDYSVIPLSLGFKIYTKKYSPYGFFFYPKVGATIINVSGSIISRNGSYDASGIGSGRHHSRGDFYYDSSLPSTTNDISVKYDYGIYASMEFGFRIPLFRKTLSKKKVELGLDISLLEVGYYIKPYHNNLVDQISVMNLATGIQDASKYLRYIVMPLPRFGLTFRF